MGHPRARLAGTGQNCGLVSRNRPVSTGFYKGFLVSFLVLNGKKVRFLQAYLELKASLTPHAIFTYTTLLKGNAVLKR